jgi:hypothetical protein
MEDELTDPVTGKFIRARLRGVDYEYGFEIVPKSLRLKSARQH